MSPVGNGLEELENEVDQSYNEAGDDQTYVNPESYVVVSHVGDGARFPVWVVGKEEVGDA